MNITLKELQELTDQPFEFLVPCTDGTILFAGPLPDKYGKGLHYERTEDGSVTIGEDDMEAWENAFAAYITDMKQKVSKPKPKRNRTRKQAEQSGAITNMPEVIALPTLRPYQNAISTVQDPAAHLQPVTQALADNLRFDNGTLYFQGMDASRVDLVQFYDKTPKAVSDLDLPTLRALYSVILQDVQDAAKDPDRIIAQVNDPQYLSHNVKIYLPDFLQMLGYKPNSSKDGVAYAVAKILSYSRILGVMEEYQGGRLYKSHYPVMQLVGHNDKDNTIQFSSPYMNRLIMTILQASIQTDRQGNYKLKSSGEPFLLASHSYLVKSSIAKERNKRAAEIVCIVVTLIEQAGDNTPHIKAQTIVDRCPDLKNALDAASSGNKSLILKRAFTAAWKMLPKQTRLAEVYKNIKFPSAIPTASTLDMVFEFPHDGKITNKEKQEK